MDTTSPYTLADLARVHPGAVPGEGQAPPAGELTAQQRVDLGAEWLDQVLPGWATSIEPERLDIASTCGCVLGQLIIDRAPRQVPVDAGRIMDNLNYVEVRFGALPLDHDDPDDVELALLGDWEDAFGAWWDGEVPELMPVPQLSHSWSTVLGFVSDVGDRVSWDQLTEAWRTKLTAP